MGVPGDVGLAAVGLKGRGQFIRGTMCMALRHSAKLAKLASLDPPKYHSPRCRGGAARALDLLQGGRLGGLLPQQRARQPSLDRARAERAAASA